jgi:hypothetical protein
MSIPIPLAAIKEIFGCLAKVLAILGWVQPFNDVTVRSRGVTGADMLLKVRG